MKYKAYVGGFTILEWLISFFIMIIVLTTVFQFSAKIYSQLIGNSKCNSIFTEMYIALDTMETHISQAPSERSKWIHISDSQLKWADEANGQNQGYLYEKQKIFFVKGKRKNVLASCVASLHFVADVVHDQMDSIRCSITFFCNKKKYALERVITLKNREIS